MKDFTATRKRFMQDPLPVRLGGLAADLARISSIAANPVNIRAVELLLEEARRFVEWTAAETEPELAGQLVDLQLALTLWLRGLPESFKIPAQRTLLAQQASVWSDWVLNQSGLVNSPG